MPPRELLRRLFDAAVASAQPDVCVPAHLPEPPAPGQGRVVVIGAGKASAAMARAVERHWAGRGVPLQGLVVTRYGHAVACEHIEIVEAAHPVPDEAGHAAAQRMLHMVQGLSPNDLVLCLISGGGSSLLPLPLPGLTLAHKQAVHQALLRSGASIGEMNCVRRHLSAIKGGRLAAACHPARVLTLLISDVPGDHPVDIASGPTVADPSTCADALAITRRYALDLPAEVQHVLASGAGESVKPGDPRLARCETRLIATPQMALQAAAQVAREAGVATAREMLLEAAVLGAHEMHARGFLNAVLPDADVVAHVQSRAKRMARLAPQAARLNKQTVRALHAHHEPMDAVLAGAYRYASSAEHREGIEAFLAKRQPVF